MPVMLLDVQAFQHDQPADPSYCAVPGLDRRSTPPGSCLAKKYPELRSPG